MASENKSQGWKSSLPILVSVLALLISVVGTYKQFFNVSHSFNVAVVNENVSGLEKALSDMQEELGVSATIILSNRGNQYETLYSAELLVSSCAAGQLR